MKLATPWPKSRIDACTLSMQVALALNPNRQDLAQIVGQLKSRVGPNAAARGLDSGPILAIWAN